MSYKNNISSIKNTWSVNTGDFYDCGPVYLFSNENISGYMPAFGDMQGANVLTVCASGDHAFESYLAGAAHVDTFDVNSLQECVMELKSHMIRDLKYEEFMDFFFNARHFFDTRMLRPIQYNFSQKLQSFISKYNQIGRSLFRYSGTQHDAFDVFKLSYISNPEKYYDLRNKLPENINFKTCDISQISDVFPYKYDVIMLSNIMDYMYPNSLSAHERWQDFYRHTLFPLSYKSLVSNNGRVCFEYMWGPRYPRVWANFISEFESGFVHGQLRQPHHTFTTHGIKPIQRGGAMDMVAIMRQNACQK